HHYLKWYKFGFTRSYDNLSLEIRNGRLTRRAAIDWLRARGDETPADDIAAFCRFVKMAPAEFFETIERFRNPAIWMRRNGRWMCGANQFESRHVYDPPPPGEMASPQAAGVYHREILRCARCGHFISVHQFDRDVLYDRAYVDSTYGDDEGMREVFERIVALP